MGKAMMIVGMFFVAAVSIALIAAAYCWIAELMDKREAKRFTRAKEEAARRIGQRLIDCSWWFSESQEARLAISLIGDDLRQYGWFNETEVREKWRAEVQTPKEIPRDVAIPSFVDARCNVSANAEVLVSELYDCYAEYCIGAGITQQPMRAFVAEVKQYVPGVGRSVRGGHVMLSGIDILRVADAADERLEEQEAEITLVQS